MHAFLLFRMTNLSGVDLDGTNDGGRTEPGRIKETSLPGLAKKTTRLQLPGLGSGSARSSSRSLFIFSEENFIRKYAQIIIEWGYPLQFSPAICRAYFRACAVRV